MSGSRYAAGNAQFQLSRGSRLPATFARIERDRLGYWKVTSGQMVSNSGRRTREREEPDPVLWRRR
jgi:hypothetical protein